MKKMLILGAGVMGSAMTVPADIRFDEIILVGSHLDDEIIHGMKKNRNLHLKHALHLPSKVKPVLFSELLPEHFQNADLIILGTNSKGVNWAIDVLIKYLVNNPPILMITKGMKSTENTLLCYPDIVQSELNRKGFNNEIAIGMKIRDLAADPHEIRSVNCATRRPAAVEAAGTTINQRRLLRTASQNFDSANI